MGKVILKRGYWDVACGLKSGRMAMSAEEIWDWRVRALFAAICVFVVIVTIILYAAQNRRGTSGARTRRAFGRIAVTLFIVAVGGMGFFKDGPACVVLLATAAVIGAMGLRMPYDCSNGVEEPSDMNDINRGGAHEESR